MPDETTFSAFRDNGRDLFLRGLVSSHAGNMSVRTGPGICIKRTGSMLGRITRDDLIDTDATGPDPNDSRASSELIVHRAIYYATAMMGADVATIPFGVLTQLMGHPLTDIGVERFLKDYEKLRK